MNLLRKLASKPSLRRQRQGFTLVELMVGIVVSLICVLAIMAAFAVYEGHKRTTTSGNDAQQNGSFALYSLERQIRTAGSGIIQGNQYSLWGCPISAVINGKTVLPASSLPAPFTSSSWPLTARVVPALIASGGTGPDVIGVLSGNAAQQAFNIPVTATPSNTVTVGNNFGVLANDYLLGTLTNGTCGLAQVSSLSGTTSIVLSTTNGPSTGLNTAVNVFDLGQAPILTLFGIDPTTNTLVYYDLLQRTVSNGASGTAATVTPLADGIVQIKALYGIHDGTTSSSEPSSYIDKWVKPTSPWDIATLTASTTAANSATTNIKAIRIVVVAQSRLPERASNYTGPTQLTLFPDLPTADQYTVSTLAQYRYKIYDTTIPLHNAMITSYF